MAYRRILMDKLRDTLSKYPIIGLTGPRQSGKTTLLTDLLPGYRYVNLENPDDRSYAEQDPKSFLATYDEKVIFDEAQNVPPLFSYLQGQVDERGEMGQFIISGSQNFNLMARITQSLAGRIALFRLFPFEFTEMREAGWLHDHLPKVFTHGFYPAVFERQVNPDRYYADYFDTYVKRDVSQLVNVQNEVSFKRFVKLCAARAGQLLNLSDLARDAGVSHTTARNWVSVLETSYILFQLPPFFSNYGKRLVKSTKLYFYDVGLLCHLLSIRKGNIDPTYPLWGAIFENMVVAELMKRNDHWALLRDYYFWRDAKGREIDLLYREGTSFFTYEIKASTTIKPDMFKHLDFFREISSEEIARQSLVYGGAITQNRMHYRVLPWKQVD